MSKLVEWIKRGMILVDGRAYPRAPEDQDLVSDFQARRMVKQKEVKILGDGSLVPKIGRARLPGYWIPCPRKSRRFVDECG